MSEFDRSKWDKKYRSGPNANERPSEVLELRRDWFPSHGNALDVAGGAGRHSIWMAQLGLDVTLLDISEEGLRIARSRAAEYAVEIATRAADLDDADLGGPWNCIVSVRFLSRAVFPRMVKALAPGGRLIALQPTLQNLERHAKPPRDFLVSPGEHLRLVDGLNVLHHEEGWLEDGLHESFVVAERSK